MPDNVQRRRREFITTWGVVRALTIVAFVAVTAVMCVRSGRSLVWMLTRSDPEPSTINGKTGSNLSSRAIGTTLANSNDDAAPEREPNTSRAAAEIRSAENYSADEHPLGRTSEDQYGRYDGKWQDGYNSEKNRYDLSNVDKWSSNQYGGGQPDVVFPDPYNFTYGTGDEGVRQTDPSMYNGGTPYSDNEKLTNSYVGFTGYEPHSGTSDSTSNADDGHLANQGYRTLPVVYRQPWDTYRQPNHPNYRPRITHPYPKVVIIPNLFETDWRMIGIVALIKLVLVKLLTSGIIATLLAALFKLKLILVTVFFKYHLLFKFSKFLFMPIQLLPAIAMFLFPMLMTFLMNLLAIPMRIQQMLQMPTAAMTGSATSQFSSPPIMSTATTRRPFTQVVPSRQIYGSDLEFKEIDSNLPQYGNDKWTNLLDHASDIVQMLMDSENCAERIACRLAVVERAGIVPSWISWTLRRVSKFLPNRKLELYFKMYDDINNDVLTTTRSSESWPSWCIERYDCNGTNYQHNRGSQ